MVAFGRSSLASLPAFLRASGMERYALLTTERAREQLSSIAIGGGDVVTGAQKRVLISGGPVAELASEVEEEIGDLSILALGGGRVIDTAKAVARRSGSIVAAIPTTLAGAPMTGSIRQPASAAKTPRPTIVIANPDLMASQPSGQRTASAMNALSHAVESLFVEGGSAIPRLAAARAVELIHRGLVETNLNEVTRRKSLALGALEAGYAIGASGYALHHVLCQTVVRVANVPHAQAYGVMLPFTLEFYKVRDDLVWSLIAERMGETDPSKSIARVVAEAGNPTTLSALGVAPERVDSIVAAVMERRELALTPGGVTDGDVRTLLSAAL